MKHVGILAHGTEGAALCFLAFCQEGFRQLGRNEHPDVTLDYIAFGYSMPAWDAGRPCGTPHTGPGRGLRPKLGHRVEGAVAWKPPDRVVVAGAGQHPAAEAAARPRAVLPSGVLPRIERGTHGARGHRASRPVSRADDRMPGPVAILSRCHRAIADHKALSGRSCFMVAGTRWCRAEVTSHVPDPGPASLDPAGCLRRPG
jgi:hypothetical protein